MIRSFEARITWLRINSIGATLRFRMTVQADRLESRGCLRTESSPDHHRLTPNAHPVPACRNQSDENENDGEEEGKMRSHQISSFLHRRSSPIVVKSQSTFMLSEIGRIE